MATTFKFGAGGPKARMVTADEKAALKSKVDQTGDLTALTRAVAAPAPAPGAGPAGGEAAPAPKPKTGAAAAPVPKPKPAAAPAPAAAAAAAPAPAKKQSSLEAPPPPKKRIDYNKFGDAKEYAITIKSEEAKNPYVVKGSRPVYPLPTRMGFQKQILKVFSDFMRSLCHYFNTFAGTPTSV